MKEIQKIMFGELRPWLESYNQSDDYYKPLTRNLTTIKPDFTTHYELNFIRYFSNKTQYYKKVIENDLICYCNNIFAETENVSNNLIAYKINKTRKQLHSKIKETAEVINNQSFSLSFITSRNVDFSIDKQYKEATYIMFYLLSALIKSWMEIQCHFKNHIIEDDMWEVSDFYTQLLQVSVPDDTYITQTSKVEISIVPDKDDDKATGEPINSLAYKYLNQQPANIADMFNALKKNKSIDQATSITDFKRIFSGVQVEVPIKWTGIRSDLSYLIKLLKNKHNVLADTKNVWEKVCACFVDENGNPFEPNNLKDQKKPVKTADEIEKIAKLMV